MKNYWFFLVLAAAVLFSGCKYKLKDRPNWDSEIVVPLAYTEVSLDNLLTDSTLTQTNADQSIDLIYRDTLVDFALADYMEVPDTSVSFTVNLQTLALSTGQISQRIYMDTLLIQLGFPPPLVPLLDNSCNATYTIDADTIENSDTVAINAGEFFQTAFLTNGWIVIEIDNRSPLNMDSLIFELRISRTGDVVVRDTLANINAGTRVIDSTFIGNQWVEAEMEGELVRAIIPFHAQNTVCWDFDTQWIDINIEMKDLLASEATAVFPQQIVIDDPSNVKYDFGDDIAITKLKIRSGELQIDAISTIQNPLDFSYSLPTTIKDGQTVLVDASLAAATQISIDSIRPAVYDTVYDLAGYYIDLSLNGDSVNLFPQHLLSELIYTGDTVRITLDDSITINYGLVDIIPEYIEGYIGKDTISVNESQILDIFRRFKGGSVDLADPNVAFTFVNSLGVDGEMHVNNISGTNTRNGNTVNLNAQPLAQPVTVSGARLPNVGQQVSTSIAIDRVNSNVRQFISNTPDQINFDIDLFANKNGNPVALDNFATFDSRILALLDMQVPLFGSSSNLTLEDTFAVNLQDAQLPDQIEEATIRVLVENDFPFEAKVQVYFLDADTMTVDSLFGPGALTIPAGVVDQNGVVQTPGKGDLTASYTADRFQNLSNQSTQARARFTINTKPDNTSVRIYSNYGIDLRLIGEFVAKIGG